MSDIAQLSPTAGALQVVLVEDNEHLRSILTERLTADGCTVRPASSGAQALELLEAAPADILITDMVMFPMDGAALVTEIRKRPGKTGKTPIIVLTNDGASVGREDLAALGVTTILIKADTPLATLRKEIDAVLAERVSA